MKKIALTIILPIYNTGNKLKATVSSILLQDFRDFELLIIDDGSTDPSTAKICEYYSRQDSRVQVFVKQNEGIEKTKIFGIAKAKGEYVMFCDHDDLYLRGSISKLINTARITKADIVSGNYYEQLFRFLPLKIKGFTIDKSRALSNKEFMESFYINFFGVNLFNVSTWAKIYRSSLLKDIDFVTLGYNTTEDVALNIQIFPKAQKIVFITDFLYVHIRGGITSKPNPENMLKNYEVLYELKQKYISQFNFTKAIPYINYEMKNILKHFVNLSVEVNISKDKIVHDLKLFKNSCTYKEVTTFYQKSKNDDSFMKNYILSEYDIIYSDACADIQKITFKKLVKKVIQ